MRDPGTAIRALEEELPGRVATDPGAIAAVAHDASHLSATAAAVCRPADPDELVRTVRWARHYRVPLTARGAGTSLDGESVPAPGGVVVDLAAWSGILELDVVDRLVRVAPGTVNADLQAALRPHGLFFPPNPGSWTTSTVGGNVATNASGPRSFRYGPTRAWVRAAEVVLGTGERLRIGGRAAKRSTGPDLVSLFVGSEGTLGVFTELTLALAPLPARRTGLAVPLPADRPLGPIARALAAASGLGLSAVEYLDRGCADALARVEGARLPSGHPLLLLEVESGDEIEEHRRLEAVGARLAELGIPEAPSVFPEADRLWTLRGHSGPVLDRTLGPRVREDVCVPLSGLDPMLEAIERAGRRAGVPVYLYAHLGQGSLHPNFAIDPSTPGAGRLREEILAEALRLGGTVSGEHGIGRLKRSFLAAEIGDGGVQLLRALKRACDPDGILNPGALLPPTGAP